MQYWADTQIAPGNYWLEEIRQGLAQAKVAILSVSASFWASSFIITKEVPALLKAAKADGVRILPVIVRPCEYEQTDLAPFQSINSLERPASGMDATKREQLWLKVVKEAQAALDATPRASSIGLSRPLDQLPIPRTPLFQGRPSEFQKLERLLFGQQEAGGVGLVGVVGMGGVGKTALAAELAERYKDRFPAGRFWMTATGSRLARFSPTCRYDHWWMARYTCQLLRTPPSGWGARPGHFRPMSMPRPLWTGWCVGSCSFAIPLVAAALQGHLPDLTLRSVQYRFLHSLGIPQRAVRQIDRVGSATVLLQ